MYIFLGDESQGDKQGPLCGKLSDGVDWEREFEVFVEE